MTFCHDHRTLTSLSEPFEAVNFCRPHSEPGWCDVYHIFRVPLGLNLSKWAAAQFHEAMESGSKVVQYYLNRPGIHQIRHLVAQWYRLNPFWLWTHYKVANPKQGLLTGLLRPVGSGILCCAFDAELQARIPSPPSAFRPRGPCHQDRRRSKHGAYKLGPLRSCPGGQPRVLPLRVPAALYGTHRRTRCELLSDLGWSRAFVFPMRRGTGSLASVYLPDLQQQARVDFKFTAFLSLREVKPPRKTGPGSKTACEMRTCCRRPRTAARTGVRRRQDWARRARLASATRSTSPRWRSPWMCGGGGLVLGFSGEGCRPLCRGGGSP